MKKLLATMLVGVVGISAIAQTVVYDYKATFKRIDPIYKLRTLDPNGNLGKAKYVTESYGIKSDTITGYVILPLCVDCSGTMISSTDYAVTNPSDAYKPVAYLMRKGDTLTKKPESNDLIKKRYIAKVPVNAAAAVFKSTLYTVPRTYTSDPQVAVPKSLSAWMTLDFAIPSTPLSAPVTYMKNVNGVPTQVTESLYLSLNPAHVIKSAASSDYTDFITYGFMGLDNTLGNKEAMSSYSAGEGFVLNKGFGTASNMTTTTAGTISVCSGTSPQTQSCVMVVSISGSVVGEFGYKGACGTTPMWNICDVNNSGVVNFAPIVGTWTLKWNKSMGSKAGTAHESAIETKLGWSNAQQAR